MVVPAAQLGAAKVALRQYGYCRLECGPNRSALEIADLFGKPIAGRARPLVQRLRPKNGGQAEPRSYADVFGLGEYPLHTDLAFIDSPPAFLVLRCSVPDITVATRVASLEKFERYLPLSLLTQALFAPRSREFSHIHLPYFSETSFGTVRRWDPLFLKPINMEACLLRRRMLSFQQENTINFHLQSPGDTVVIDNNKVIHGRSAVDSPHSARELERVFLGELYD